MTALLPDCFLPASFLDVGCRTAHQLQEINNQTADTPFTLRHSDSHLDNLMFAHNEEGPPLTVIDWRCCGGGPGVSDIGYFLIFSMPVYLRRESEHRLLHLYHETLIAHGVTNYSFDQCWRDYRLAFFKNLITAVVVVNLLDLTRPHGRAFLQVMIPRLASFAEDHCVSDLL